MSKGENNGRKNTRKQNECFIFGGLFNPEEDRGYV